MVTLCNRSKAKLKDGEDVFGALEDAIQATTIAPEWSKARFRCGEAYAALSAWSLAVTSLRVGEKLVEFEKGTSLQPFKDFLDVIAIKAAKNGSPAGFDGRVIYVRSAGEEAWLGKDAPTNAQFDVTDEHKNPINTERYSKEDGYMAEARRKAEVDKHTALHARSIREAVEMASDGDKILLLRGIHNGAGETVCVTKRVWIKGEGALKEATIDMRANSPTFRITRSCVVSNVDFDFSGFAESLRIAQMERGNILNKRQYETLIEGCSFSCTGCDGLVVTDKAKATFRNCDITGKNNALASRVKPTPLSSTAKSTGVNAPASTSPTTPRVPFETASSKIPKKKQSSSPRTRNAPSSPTLSFENARAPASTVLITPAACSLPPKSRRTSVVSGLGTLLRSRASNL